MTEGSTERGVNIIGLWFWGRQFLYALVHGDDVVIIMKSPRWLVGATGDIISLATSVPSHSHLCGCRAGQFNLEKSSIIRPIGNQSIFMVMRPRPVQTPTVWRPWI